MDRMITAGRSGGASRSRIGRSRRQATSDRARALVRTREHATSSSGPPARSMTGSKASAASARAPSSVHWSRRVPPVVTRTNATSTSAPSGPAHAARAAPAARFARRTAPAPASAAPSAAAATR
ncbi:hypothetical protein DVA67_005745 [Solirubrobacter sp. CPCC 204708]|nr:hypothetical protein [Solirubrobacter deserti]